ncbi:MAG: ABC transporter ATP-binding protein [Anaerolineae bacterium]|nr:ABC transporter ATP-binding protein [Anaerolineae bacterium]
MRCSTLPTASSNSPAPHVAGSTTVNAPLPQPEGGAAGAAIRTLDLVKQYGSITALAGLTMTVGRGEVFGFLGPNGAGKTTAVKLLVGLTRPTAGQAWLLDVPIGDRVTRRRIGYLPELFRYQDWLTAREVLALHCALADIPAAERPREIEHTLETVGLAARGGDRVGTFSKGMQQRLGLGVALLGRPEVVFLDEPTSALDPVGRRDVREIVRGLKARGATVFLNSHLLSEVELVCDRVAIVDKGRVVALGSLHEVIGGAQAVRVRLTGLNGAGHAALHSYGDVRHEGDWVTVTGLDADAVPDLVADLVRAGVQIHAVEPRHDSLEDRFLQLLTRPDDAAVEDTS